MKKKLLIPICLLLVLTMAGCCRNNPETEPHQPTAKVSAASENDTGEAEMPQKPETEDKHPKLAAEPADGSEPEKQEYREEPMPAPKPTEIVKPELTPNLTPTPIPTPTPENEIDIEYWVAYAKNYAISVGLTLDCYATDCWDNPITANSKCRYLDRDIQDILNRYSRDEDITEVWIWSEALGNGNYNIYIGYA